MEFVKAFRAARRVSTPLIAVRTPDPASTMKTIVESMNGDANKIPVLHWDVMRGIIGVNQAGKQEAARLLDGGDPALVSARPSEALAMVAGSAARKGLAEDGILFMANIQMYWDKEQVRDASAMIIQGIWNVRDQFKAKGSTLVLLTTTGATVPSELAQDVLVLDEPLPTADELNRIVDQVFTDSKVPKPKPELMNKAVDAIIGLAAFPAEQTVAMCLSRNGLNYEDLWDRKRQAIEQVRGLSVWRGSESVEEIGGYESLKQYAERLRDCKEPPGCIVFMDEVEKHFAGSGTDLSGVKTGMEGAFLSWTQDKKVAGNLLLGPPGVGKSVFAKAFGRLLGVPVIQLDFDGLQESLVGKSGENFRNATKIIDAISRNRPHMIGACNTVDALSPAVRRRFKMGTFFVDLPSKEERDKIWEIYFKKYNLTDKEIPSDVGWTGAEIEECARKAYIFGIPLKESAKYIVPVATSMSEIITRQRKEANGRYLSATNSGVYQYVEEPEATKPTRKITLPDFDGITLGKGGRVGEA